MKKRINLLIILFILIILIPLIIPNVFSTLEVDDIKEIKQSSDISQKDMELINNNTFSLISDLSKIDKSFTSDFVSEPFSKKTLLEYDIPIEKGCQKIEDSKVLDIFVPKTEFSFQEKKEQPIIHPTLEETIVLKVNNEIKKKRELMANISFNRTIPEVISQKEIRLEKFSGMLRKNKDFKDTYEYAKGLGYTELNRSIEMTYNNGAV